MKTFEAVHARFNGATDATDYAVVWIAAQDEETVRNAIGALPFNVHAIEMSPHDESINHVLPLNLEACICHLHLIHERITKRNRIGARMYRGAWIEPAARNSSGIRWTALVNGHNLRADTLNGIKSLIRHYTGANK